MGLFKSADEREQEKRQKEEAIMNKYGLSSLSDPEDIASVRKIVQELTGTGLMEFGVTLGGGSEKDIARIQMYYLRAIMEQNFIIIRQLDKLTKK